MTANEFMNNFEYIVQQYGDDFFFKGARELLSGLRTWGLEKNQHSVDNFIRDCLLYTRENPHNPPSIDFVRDELIKILS